jgi:tetratricopeptide (TPR) repeat protein
VRILQQREPAVLTAVPECANGPRRNCFPVTGGTEGSNPSPSSGESVSRPHSASKVENNARAHGNLGILRRVRNRLDEARIEFETAIALDRNNTMTFRNLGLTLVQMGKPEEAIPYIEKSIRLSPHAPDIGNNYNALGQCHLFLGHLDQAIELLRKARAADPRPFGLHLILAGALGLRGDLDEARAEVTEASKLKPEVNSLADWGGQSSSEAPAVVVHPTEPTPPLCITRGADHPSLGGYLMMPCCCSAFVRPCVSIIESLGTF